MLACFESKALVAHLLQGDDLLAYFILRQFFARNGVVFAVIGAIHTTVYAVVRQIKRSKKHDAVAIELLLHLAGKVLEAFH